MAGPDVFQLPGTVGGTGNGYWSTDATNNSVSTWTNANGINFIFQRSTLYPTKVRLTWLGSVTYTAASLTPGDNFAYVAVIPLSTLPVWCQPVTPVGTTNFTGVGLGIGPAEFRGSNALGATSAILSTDGTSLRLKVSGNPVAVVAAPGVAQNFYNVIDYFID